MRREACVEEEEGEGLRGSAEEVYVEATFQLQIECLKTQAEAIAAAPIDTAAALSACAPLFLQGSSSSPPAPPSRASASLPSPTRNKWQGDGRPDTVRIGMP